MRYRVVGSPSPLSTPVEDPLHKTAFAYRVQGVEEAAQATVLIEVYAQRGALYPYAERACRLLLACHNLARTRLGLDHSLRYDRLLRVFLMTEGKAGAEQQRNLLYLYDLSERMPPHEWVRELTHEYGHWILPPINSYVEPEPWANGDLGERWFTYHLMEQQKHNPVVSSGAMNPPILPDSLMGASLNALEAYLHRAVEPLVERIAREGLNLPRWRSRRRDGFEEFLAFALYIDRVYGCARLGRAMLCAGGVEPDDFLRGARESLTEVEPLEAQLPFKDAYLFLPGGAMRWIVIQPRGAKLTPDAQRPEWARANTATLTLRLR
ncbi:MAG: hypothetical protein KatS3mg017_0495 [Fimbriimonadales bacterium]|nr:MAG: hypothetical protein KatS3mg017_0495 [Fimbriimonadales bacterium]GIV07984.1 MAG: hypothetical protein KatS3mg019_0075 [Fimbriimonadales bacterium]